VAQLDEQVAIVPQKGSIIVPSTGQVFTVSVKEYDAAGKMTELLCELPATPEFAKWSLMQQVVMLKRGTWQALSVPEIIWGLTYANRIGADVVMGDLYPTGNGRWGTSNKYKIKQALATGRITSIETSIVDTKLAIDLPKCIQKTDLECTATIGVKGFDKPIVRKARLSRWFKVQNPNWVGNPEHMLELNTVAHACEYVVPGPTEADEQPPAPAETSSNEGDLEGLLKASLVPHTKIGNLGS